MMGESKRTIALPGRRGISGALLRRPELAIVPGLKQNLMRAVSVLFLAALATGLVCQPAWGQSGLRESLERLDLDSDGEIDTEEITPLSRPYLERIAETRRMSLEREYSIERWLEAARIYYAVQNGVAERRIRPVAESSVKPFGTDDDQPLLPEFGLAKVRYPYTEDDLEQAERIISRYDRDDDGYIDRREARRGDWTHRNPFDDDYNQDNRLSRLELGQRYARRRLLDDASDQLRQKARRTESMDSRRDDDDRYRRSEESQYWRRGGSRYYLTSSVMSRFDRNRNGRLDQQEAAPLGIPLGRIDADRDGELSRQELYAFLGELQDEVGGMADALPGWFYELDENRDEQVAMSEFSSEWTDEKLSEFNAYDANGDGLLTASEVLQSKSLVGGAYLNDEAEILPPRKTVISEIVIDEDYLIGDLNVQLSITHTYLSYLDAYLTGPDGQRIELFTAVGGSDDHFEETILDDQSQSPITKARAPFKGRFQPEALAKRQPSLSQFNGKSIQGVWQLVIRCSRSERFGMLHSWGLIVQPQDDMMDAGGSTPQDDGLQPTSTTPAASRTSSERPQEISQPARVSSAPSTVKPRVWSGNSDSEANRQRAIEQFKEYVARMKQQGQDIPSEKKAYFQKLSSGDGADASSVEDDHN